MHSKNIDKCGENPQSARRKPNYHTTCGKICHKILSVYKIGIRFRNHLFVWIEFSSHQLFSYIGEKFEGAKSGEYGDTERVGILTLSILQPQPISFLATVSNRGTHLAESFLLSKSWWKILCTHSFDMPTARVIPRSFALLSSINISWTLSMISGRVVALTGCPERSAIFSLMWPLRKIWNHL